MPLSPIARRFVKGHLVPWQDPGNPPCLCGRGVRESAGGGVRLTWSPAGTAPWASRVSKSQWPPSEPVPKGALPPQRLPSARDPRHRHGVGANQPQRLARGHDPQPDV